jgi:hypothetical protein
MRTIWGMLLAAAATAGCSSGGGLFATPQPPAEAVPPVVMVAGLVVAPDGTVLVPGVQNVSADRSRQGVILRAEGIAPTQGFYSPELVSTGVPGGDGIEVVQLRALPPVEAQPVGAQRTRILAVGRFYTNREMEGIRGFRVMAGQNALSVTAPAPLPPPPPPPPPEF